MWAQLVYQDIVAKVKEQSRASYLSLLIVTYSCLVQVVYQDIVARVKEQATATAAGARIAQVALSRLQQMRGLDLNPKP